MAPPKTHIYSLFRIFQKVFLLQTEWEEIYAAHKLINDFQMVECNVFLSVAVAISTQPGDNKLE